MRSPRMEEVFSHWHHLFEGMQQSPQDFYERLERAIAGRDLPKSSFSRITISEGGVFSAKRIYLRVGRKPIIFDICGAPFGNGFFISWWLSELQGCLMIFLLIPVIGPLVNAFAKPITYYKLDTAQMFQDSVHAAVLEVIDEITHAQGLRALPESERAPIMRDFFGARR